MKCYQKDVKIRSPIGEERKVDSEPDGKMESWNQQNYEQKRLRGNC